MSKSRQDYLDIVAGILIIFMVYHHAFPNSSLDVWGSRFLFFYMSWFFFKAGVFFRKEFALKDVFLKSARRLLLPFVVFSVIGQVVYAIELTVLNNLHMNFVTNTILDIIKTGAIFGNGPLWFLLTLFFVRILYASLCKMVRLLWIIPSFFGFFAFIFYHFEITTPLYLGNTCLGAFFFGLGTLLKNMQYKIPIFIACSIVYLVTVSFLPTLGSFVNNNSESYIWWIVASLAGIITYNNVFKIINPQKRFFGFCGQHSLEILVSHMPIISLVRFIL